MDQKKEPQTADQENKLSELAEELADLAPDEKDADALRGGRTCPGANVAAR